MIIKPLFRSSSVLFGFFIMALVSIAAVSGSESLAKNPNHMAEKPSNYGELLFSDPLSEAPQIPSSNPTITIWYGSSQDFGFLGNPQPMINILGNVSDPDGIASLEYKLNNNVSWNELSWRENALTSGLSSTIPGGLSDGIQAKEGTTFSAPGSVQSVNGPSNNPRLVSEGDFNIEINLANLISGPNTVSIRARDNAIPQNTTTELVTVNYTSGQTWPLPYTADWDGGITNVAQVVDGKWYNDGGRLRPVVTGYDRVVAMGELLAWDDFEVRVPIIIHNIPFQNTGGVGIVARWQGHFVVNNEQPGTGWWHIGAYAYYRNRECPPPDGNGDECPHYALRTSNAEPFKVYDTLIEGITYNFKLRVQTKAACGGDGLYSFKVWPVGNLEPTSWIFEECDDPSNAYDKGSALLVAHNIDASFGDVTILPVLDVNVTPIGNGMVDVAPSLVGLSDAYIYGDSITLTATADPGWIFDRWSGDLSGNTNPLTLNLSDDLNATANFVRLYSLDLNEIGNGKVDADPPGPEYPAGTEVELTATADPGWTFTGWSGDFTGSDNPLTFTINEDKQVTANFDQTVNNLNFVPLIITNGP